MNLSIYLIAVAVTGWVARKLMGDRSSLPTKNTLAAVALRGWICSEPQVPHRQR